MYHFNVHVKITKIVQCVRMCHHFLTGGKCEVECTDRTSCREWGQFLCLCDKGKKGPNCEQTGIYVYIPLVY